MKRARSGAFDHRIIGAMLAGVIGLVLYIAFTANSGLPGESRYRVTARVPDALRLIADADVRVGGVRVGRVADVSAVPGGVPSAELALELEPSAAPLPVDTRIAVRPASVLGLTYVDLQPGVSDDIVPDGGRLPSQPSNGTVELTDLFSVFDERTRRGLQDGVRGLSDGLAGRGADLNGTIAALADAMPDLERVATTIARSPTADLLTQLDRAARVVAPEAAVLAATLGAAATTFDALDEGRLDVVLARAPSALRTSSRALAVSRPALRSLTALTAALRPAGPLLAPALRRTGQALHVVRRPLRRTPRFAVDLERALAAVDQLARRPSTSRALIRLRRLAAATTAVLEKATPAQVHCNSLALWGINFSGVFGGLGAGDGPGLINLVLTTLGAESEASQNPRPSRNVGINPLPTLDSTECEAGNEPYTGRQQLNNPPGRQSRTTRPTVPPPGVSDLARGAGLLDDPERSP